MDGRREGKHKIVILKHFNMATTQRDVVGYGEHQPKVTWPGGCHVALNFVINYEEGGENCILDGDAGSEALLSEIVG